MVALIALCCQGNGPGEAAAINFHYYEPRCAHSSSLSAAMHALVAARIGDREHGSALSARDAGSSIWTLTRTRPAACASPAWAGCGQAVVLGFGGVDLERRDCWQSSRGCPPQWRALSFRISCRGRCRRSPHRRTYRSDAGGRRSDGDQDRGCRTVFGTRRNGADAAVGRYAILSRTACAEVPVSCKANIGFALAISTVASLCSQIPAGALIDAIRDKRRPVRIGLLGICCSAFPDRFPRAARD